MDMHVLRAKNKQELLAEISGLNGCDQEVYINLRPTLEIVEALTKRCANLQKIMCPPSLLKQTSKKVFRSLQSTSVKLGEGDFRVGRPNKYDAETLKQIAAQRAAGKQVKNIAAEMDIPLRTVYFYLKNGNRE
jgi:hypothetical protein